MHHFRGTYRDYAKLNKNDVVASVACSLCREISNATAVDENDTMVVVRNRVAYDIFEGRRTTGEHYMILPKRHCESIAEFSDQEKLDMLTLASRFESQGFNMYARGSGSANRSQLHQHTHLIRLVDKPAKLLVYLARPYFVAHIE